MPTWTAWGEPGSDVPTALQSEHGHVIAEPNHRASTALPLDRFEAETQDAAVAYYNSLKRDGFKAQLLRPIAPMKQWRFRGSPKFLTNARKRTGLSQVQADLLVHNFEIKEIASRLGGICHQYFEALRSAFGQLTPDMRRSVAARLDLCDHDVDKLHTLAAASAEMVNDTRTALGFPAPPRHFAIISDFDPPVPHIQAGEPSPDEPILNPTEPLSPAPATGKKVKTGV